MPTRSASGAPRWPWAPTPPPPRGHLPTLPRALLSPRQGHPSSSGTWLSSQRDPQKAVLPREGGRGRLLQPPVGPQLQP